VFALNPEKAACSRQHHLASDFACLILLGTGWFPKVSTWLMLAAAAAAQATASTFEQLPINPIFI
jgi:hypothetical protein